MDKDGELDVLHDILALDGDMDTMEADVDATLHLSEEPCKIIPTTIQSAPDIKTLPENENAVQSSEDDKAQLTSGRVSKSLSCKNGSKQPAKTAARGGDEKLRLLAEERHRLEKENEENLRKLLKRFDEKRFYVADTTKIEDKLERKKLKRTARKKAAPKAKRTTPRGSNKKKLKKLARGQSKR